MLAMLLATHTKELHNWRWNIATKKRLSQMARAVAFRRAELDVSSLMFETALCRDNLLLNGAKRVS